MPKEITIKNFQGLNLEEGLWSKGYASYVAGLDIFGLAKNPSKISYPGVLQGIFQVSAGAQAASPSAVTELVLDFETYSGQDFALGAANPGRIYRRDSGSWKWVSAITVSSCASPAAALKTYGANLLYAQQAVLGQYDNTNGNANFQSLLSTTIGPRKMKILNGSVYGLDNRYVWKYDGTTFDNDALTLPSDWTGRDIEVYGDYLYITADNGSQSMLIVWDGVSASYQTPLPIYEELNAPSLVVSGGILWLVANRGVATTGTPLYAFDGSQFIKIQTLPIQRSQTVGLADYSGGPAIGSNDDSIAAYEDGVAGVWLVNRYSSKHKYNAVLGFPLRNEFVSKTLGAIKFFGQNGYIAAQDTATSTFEVFELQGSQANTPNIWQSLPIDAGATTQKIWHYVKINLDDPATSQSVVVKYRLNDDTAFTTLKTLSSTSSASELIAQIPINRAARTLTIRVELTASASETTRVHSITLGFTVLGR